MITRSPVQVLAGSRTIVRNPAESRTSSALYRLDAPVGMAVYTAVGILVLAFAILFADPDRGLLRVVVRRTAGGVLARRLLPIAMVMPLVLGLVFLVAGERLGWFGLALGASLLVMAAIVILAALVLHTAAALDRRARGGG